MGVVRDLVGEHSSCEQLFTVTEIRRPNSRCRYEGIALRRCWVGEVSFNSLMGVVRVLVGEYSSYEQLFTVTEIRRPDSRCRYEGVALCRCWVEEGSFNA